MTSWEADLQKTYAAGFAAWGTLMNAASTAMIGMWATVVDWAVDEQVVAPVNASAVLVHSDRPTMLHGRFHRADDDSRSPIRPELVRFDPPALPAMPAGNAIMVIVHVLPGPEPAAGADPEMADMGYIGEILDDLGHPLSDVPVYVAVHVPWGP